MALDIALRQNYGHRAGMGVPVIACAALERIEGGMDVNISPRMVADYLTALASALSNAVSVPTSPAQKWSGKTIAKSERRDVLA